MPSAIAKGNLFPSEVTNQIKNLVRGQSSLAKLSNQAPLSFNGTTEFVFNFDGEAEVVGERGAKSNTGASIAPVTVQPFKVVAGTRVTDEFLIASDTVKLDILKEFRDGFARKLARTLDITAMHGKNPKTGTVLPIFGNGYFDAAVTQTVAATNNANTDVESAVALVQAQQHEVTGLAMSPKLKADLAKLTKSDGTPYYPQLQWGGKDVEQLNGVPIHSNDTVAFDQSKDLGIIGNFAELFRWGIARDINLQVLTAGNPDNSADGDLAGHNEVYIRGEAYIGFAILDPTAFARIVSGGA